MGSALSRRHRGRAPSRRLPGGAGVLALTLLAGCVVQSPARPPAPRAPLPAAASPVGSGLPMYFYPERGQPEAQQSRDRYECWRWAVDQTGTDPGMTPLRHSAVPAATAARPARAERLRGGEVAAGAVAGAVIGAATASRHHVAEGVVLGAIFGAALGSAAQAQAQREADARALRPPPAAAPLPERWQTPFRRAMSACMQGRAYRIG